MIVPKRKWRYPLAIEREYARFLVQLVQKKFEVIESFLPEMTDKVFENRIRQDGFGDWLGNLVDKVKRKVEKISALPIINKIFGKVDKHVKTEQSETFKSVFGAEVQQKTPPKFEMLKTIWTAQNMTLIKSIDEQTMQKIQFNLSQKIMSAADKEILLKDLTKEIQEIAKVSESRAALIGADQVGKLNGKLVQYRQQSAGIEYFIWRTRGDNRIRPNHAAKNGVVYKWSSPVEKPGEAVRCRCVAQPVIDEQSFKLVPQKNFYTNLSENDKILSPKGLGAGDKIFMNVEGTPPKLIDKLPNLEKSTIEKSLAYFENQIVNAKVENGFVITAEGEIYHCTGHLVGLPTIEDLGEKLKGAIVTHNHPDSSVNEHSFSGLDWSLFERYNLKILRGVEKNFIYELNRNKEDSKLSDLILDGKDDLNGWHNVILIKALNNGYGYRRWRRE